MIKLARLRGSVELQRGAERDPVNVEANFNAAITRLCLAIIEGWKQYEHRWKKKSSSNGTQFTQPMWRGEGNLHGKTIAQSEQGFGDIIQFVRYAPLVAALGAKVIARRCRVRSRALRDRARHFAGAGERRVLPEFDLFCPLLEPAARVRDRAGNGACEHSLSAALSGPPRGVEREVAGQRPTCVSEYAGPAIPHLNDRNRSIALERFMPLLSMPGIDFVSMQKEVNAAQAALLSAHGVRQLGQQFEDFAETAAVVAMLDLVIAVDTSVAHLAGAMGKADRAAGAVLAGLALAARSRRQPLVSDDAAVPAGHDRRLGRAVRAARAGTCRGRATAAPAAR